MPDASTLPDRQTHPRKDPGNGPQTDPQNGPRNDPQTNPQTDPQTDPARGRCADRPREITLRGWRDVLLRLWNKFNNDSAMLIAGGVTFYLLLALFAGLAAIVSVFGLVSDPAVVAREAEGLRGLVPDPWLEIIGRQLTELAAQGSGTLGFGLALSLGVALWTANNGVKAIFEAMNIAYSEREKRSLLTLHLQSFTFTLGCMMVGIALVAAVGVVPALLALFDLDEVADAVVRIARWAVLLPVIGAMVALFYRYGPSREPAAWRWVTWGSGIATVAWLAVSLAYSVYLQSFADYQAVYGSLGALVGFLFWIWLSVLILIVGAQLNAEMELQTRRDTTDEPDAPMGERGAYVADHVGAAAEALPR